MVKSSEMGSINYNLSYQPYQTRHLLSTLGKNKEQLSSLKTVNMVVVQSSTANLTNFENRKSIKGNWRSNFCEGLPKL